jgi:transcriptional regulator with XRE-family HTH domain
MSAPERRVNLRAERLNRGLSTREAAEAIGVSQAVLLRGERGEGLRPRHAKRVADFYELKVTDVWPLPEDTEPVEYAPPPKRRPRGRNAAKKSPSG